MNKNNIITTLELFRNLAFSSLRSALALKQSTKSWMATSLPRLRLAAPRHDELRGFERSLLLIFLLNSFGAQAQLDITDLEVAILTGGPLGEFADFPELISLRQEMLDQVLDVADSRTPNSDELDSEEMTVLLTNLVPLLLIEDNETRQNIGSIIQDIRHSHNFVTYWHRIGSFLITISPSLTPERLVEVRSILANLQDYIEITMRALEVHFRLEGNIEQLRNIINVWLRIGREDRVRGVEEMILEVQQEHTRTAWPSTQLLPIGAGCH